MSQENESDEMNSVVLGQILARLDTVVEQMRSLDARVGEAGKLGQAFEVWKAETNIRLQAGCDRMDEIEREVEERVEKRVLFAYLTGAASAGAGLGAGLIKLLGG